MDRARHRRPDWEVPEPSATYDEDGYYNIPNDFHDNLRTRQGSLDPFWRIIDPKGQLVDPPELVQGFLDNVSRELANFDPSKRRSYDLPDYYTVKLAGRHPDDVHDLLTPTPSTSSSYSQSPTPARSQSPDEGPASRLASTAPSSVDLNMRDVDIMTTPVSKTLSGQYSALATRAQKHGRSIPRAQRTDNHMRKRTPYKPNRAAHRCRKTWRDSRIYGKQAKKRLAPPRDERGSDAVGG